MRRSSSGLLVMAALAAVPVAHEWTSPSSSALARTVEATKHKSKPHKSKKTASHTYKGPLLDFQYGAIQASVTVKGKKITNVVINAQPDSARGQFIDDQAVPVLRQETLKAQSANIDLVSGATQTSEAYIQTLQSALKRAHL